VTDNFFSDIKISLAGEKTKKLRADFG